MNYCAHKVTEGFCLDCLRAEVERLKSSLHALATGLRWEEELRAWVLADLGALTRARQALEVGSHGEE
jgi:hypothetical protein